MSSNDDVAKLAVAILAYFLLAFRALMLWLGIRNWGFVGGV